MIQVPTVQVQVKSLVVKNPAMSERQQSNTSKSRQMLLLAVRHIGAQTVTAYATQNCPVTRRSRETSGDSS